MHIAKINLIHILWRKDLLLCLCCALVFYYFPEIDLWISAQFYDGHSFYLNQHPLVYGVYRLFANMHFVALGVLIIASLASLFVHSYKAKALRKSCCFIFLVLLLGPGLLVNGLLKNHSLGRVRPVQIEQFGGQDHFTPAFVYSGECRKNCSFVSGHAALGFAFMSLFFIYRHPFWLASGIGIGVIVGTGRIMQEGHFLSDVLFSFWATYFCTLLLAWLFGCKSAFFGMGTMKPKSPLQTYSW